MFHYRRYQHAQKQIEHKQDLFDPFDVQCLSYLNEFGTVVCCEFYQGIHTSISPILVFEVSYPLELNQEILKSCIVYYYDAFNGRVVCKLKKNKYVVEILKRMKPTEIVEPLHKVQQLLEQVHISEIEHSLPNCTSHGITFLEAFHQDFCSKQRWGCLDCRQMIKEWQAQVQPSCPIIKSFIAKYTK